MTGARPRVAVVGAGPSGLYAAAALAASGTAVDVDVLDRLPAPYGLVRYGVAPDHMKMKSVIRVLARPFGPGEVRFLGGVAVGTGPGEVPLAVLSEHYTAVVDEFLPTPVRGRLPVWVAARWPNRRPMRRAARHDGLFLIDGEPADLPAAIAEVARARDADLGRDMDGYDVVVDAPPGSDPRPWEDAGATWWLASPEPFDLDVDAVRAVAEAGPPR